MEPVSTDASPSASSSASSSANGDSDREERLVSVLSRARRGTGLTLTERGLFAVGGALAVAGLLLIVVGWVGTSQTVLVAGQIPYVVSGGLLGVALVFLGGFLYFGHWLALAVRAGREQADEAHEDALRLEAALLSFRIAVGAATGPSARLVRTPSGSMVHRLDCPSVAGRNDLRDVTDDPSGLKPCAICSPLAVVE